MQCASCRQQHPHAQSKEGSKGGDCHLSAAEEEAVLAWCRGLDFDLYADDWTCIATSLGSEAFVPVLERPELPDIPYWNPLAGLTGASAWTASTCTEFTMQAEAAAVAVSA